MRTLMLMRHAAAVAAGADHARTLSPRGESEAGRVGAWLADAGDVPQLILSSDAVRARATAEAVAAAFREAPPLVLDRDLYLASPARILDRVSQVEGACTALLLVVHNPGASELAAWLRGTGDPAAVAREERGFVPAALAVFRVDRPAWTQIVRGCGRLVAFAEPSLCE